MSKEKKIVVGDNHQKNFAKLLEFISQRHNPFTIFSDFLTIAAMSISNNSDPYHIATSEKIKSEREKRYLNVIGKYDAKEQKYFSMMFAELVLELENNCSGKSTHMKDVLGELFQESNFNDQWKGQFFTPQHICDLTGKLVIGDNEKVQTEIKQRGYFTIYEPCCGGGAMIYGAVNAVCEIGLNPNKNVLVFAGDIDERCVFMTYIQCSLYGIPAIVIQKDAIINKVFGEAWYTPLYVFYNRRWNNEMKECLA